MGGMADREFTLTRIKLSQFRSLKDIDVKLGKLTVLVGPNGSGKSNVLDFLRLVSESLTTSLDQRESRFGDPSAGAHQ